MCCAEVAHIAVGVLRLSAHGNGLAIDLRGAKMRARERLPAGGRRVIALLAEIIPRMVFPTTQTVLDFAIDCKAAAGAFGMKVLVQT
ncbi:MAG: hypothetical protein ACJ8EL_22220 [Rhizomicrobium sp.]|jgi:hypothetical protein